MSIKALKSGQAIDKPIYNHETGIDPPERVEPNHIIVVEGHPLYDERCVADFSVYLDISDEVKIAWKIQRDMAEHGATLRRCHGCDQRSTP